MIASDLFYTRFSNQLCRVLKIFVDHIQVHIQTVFSNSPKA